MSYSPRHAGPTRRGRVPAPPEFLSYRLSRGEAFPPRSPFHCFSNFFSRFFSCSARRKPWPVIVSGRRIAHRRKKVAGNRILSAEMLEPRTLFSAASLFQELCGCRCLPVVLFIPRDRGRSPVVHAPTVATAAAASSSAVTGTTVAALVLGSDAAGQQLRLHLVDRVASQRRFGPDLQRQRQQRGPEHHGHLRRRPARTFSRRPITDPAGLSVTSSVTVTSARR